MCSNKNDQIYLITLNRININREDEILKCITTSGTFTAELDAMDCTSIIFKKNVNEELMRFTFESNIAAEEAMESVRNFLSNESTLSDYKIIELSLIWDDPDQKYEREKIWKERKESWESCECSDEDGCEKCLKNPKFVPHYLGEEY